MGSFTFLFNISWTNITIVSHLLHLNTYKKSFKTNLLEEYVNFVDNTKKQKKIF